MQFFDWVFGQSNLGNYKTFAISGLLGIGILVIVTGFSKDPQPGAKYLCILIGYPILAVLRVAYWQSRRDSLMALVESDGSAALGAIRKLANFNDQLMMELLQELDLRNTLGE
jgi:hypothetical protein